MTKNPIGIEYPCLQRVRTVDTAKYTIDYTRIDRLDRARPTVTNWQYRETQIDPYPTWRKKVDRFKMRVA